MSIGTWTQQDKHWNLCFLLIKLNFQLLKSNQTKSTYTHRCMHRSTGMASVQGREGTCSLAPQPPPLQCPTSWAAWCNKPWGVPAGSYQKFPPILGLTQHLCSKHHSFEHLPPRQVSTAVLEGLRRRSLPTRDLTPCEEGAVAPPRPWELPTAWGVLAGDWHPVMPLLCPDRQLRGCTQDRRDAPEQRGQPVWLGTCPGASRGCCRSDKRSHIPAATATCTGPGAPAQLLAAGGLGSLWSSPPHVTVTTST